MSDQTIILRAVFKKTRKAGAFNLPIGTGDLENWKKSISDTITVQLGGKIIDQKSTPGQPTAFYHIDFEVAATLAEKAKVVLGLIKINNRYREQLMPLHEVQAGIPKSPQV